MIEALCRDGYFSRAVRPHAVALPNSCVMVRWTVPRLRRGACAVEMRKTMGNEWCFPIKVVRAENVRTGSHPDEVWASVWGIWTGEIERATRVLRFRRAPDDAMRYAMCSDLPTDVERLIRAMVPMLAAVPYAV